MVRSILTYMYILLPKKWGKLTVKKSMEEAKRIVDLCMFSFVFPRINELSKLFRNLG